MVKKLESILLRISGDEIVSPHRPLLPAAGESLRHSEEERRLASVRDPVRLEPRHDPSERAVGIADGGHMAPAGEQRAAPESSDSGAHVADDVRRRTGPGAADPESEGSAGGVGGQRPVPASGTAFAPRVLGNDARSPSQTKNGSDDGLFLSASEVLSDPAGASAQIDAILTNGHLRGDTNQLRSPSAAKPGPFFSAAREFAQAAKLAGGKRKFGDGKRGTLDDQLRGRDKLRAVWQRAIRNQIVRNRMIREWKDAGDRRKMKRDCVKAFAKFNESILGRGGTGKVRRRSLLELDIEDAAKRLRTKIVRHRYADAHLIAIMRHSKRLLQACCRSERARHCSASKR